MKKLMIAAAIVCAAVASQAAQFKWSASDVLGPDGETPYSGTATLYAYLITDTAADAVVVNSTSMNNGEIKAADTLFDGGELLVVGSQYNFFYTMETTYQGKDWTWTSGEVMAKAQSNSTPNLKFFEEGAWTTSAIPEPTSGLLLLLGVAGLALRRRRA